MLRSSLFVCVLILANFVPSQQGFTKDPGPRLIATLDEPTATWVRGLVHGTRIQVLQPTPDESPADFDRRVLQLRDSVCLVVLTKCDSIVMQMYRERLRNQGVLVIDLSARTSRRMTVANSQPRQTPTQGLSDLTQLMSIEVPSNLYVSQ